MRKASLPVRTLRLLWLGWHLVQGMLTVSLVFPLATPTRRNHLKRNWSQQLLRILDIRLHVHGHTPREGTHGVLFVANHISWVDIFALNAVHPVHFIAKSDIRSWPLLGWLADKSGTLFIERARRQDTGRVARTATRALDDGHCLCFFPEGTTTDGSHMLPFKTGLLQPALDAEAVIWPVAICYPLETQGEKQGINTAMAYWGDISMWQSLTAILAQRHAVAELHFGAPIRHWQQDRRTLAVHLREIISSLQHPQAHAAPASPSGHPAVTR